MSLVATVLIILYAASYTSQATSDVECTQVQENCYVCSLSENNVPNESYCPTGSVMVNRIYPTNYTNTTTYAPEEVICCPDNDDTLYHILLPCLFVTGLLLGMLVCYLLYIKRVTILPKLMYICCPCINRKYVLSEISMLEVPEEQQIERPERVELVSGACYDNTLFDVTDERKRLPTCTRQRVDVFTISTDSDAVAEAFTEGFGLPVEEEDETPIPPIDHAPPSDVNELDELIGIAEDMAETAHSKNMWKNFNFTNTRFAAGLFDKEGGQLSLVEMGINLFIPPGAIDDKDAPAMIYIYVNKGQHSIVPPSPNQLVVSPTVYCGPPGATFGERVVLSYQHCAASNGSNVIALCTKTEVGVEEDFRNISEDGSCFRIMKENKCFLFVDHFTGFTTIVEGGSAKKIMDVVCYTESLVPATEKFPIRLYCVNQTADAKQIVREQEFDLGGKQTGLAQQIMIDSQNQEDLEFAVKRIMPDSWKVNKILERESVEVVVEKAILNSKTRGPQRMNYEHRLKISQLLDVDSPDGNDWRMFASKLDLDWSFIKEIETLYRQNVIRSPTFQLLNIWEMENSDLTPTRQLEELSNLFSAIERKDVVRVMYPTPNGSGT
ncbi:UNC5C-like protein [Saccoglossus kowalevskii]|uniref:Netrin receptor UNC5 n=1 Tax=Saccoglossus kowalevskii TaxID=10224 RepID=A0ABM0MXQ0_SACKO|nr:PREDICTED: UNC5C-like protein-like [Saccoglossus kowalevskii]